MITSTKSETNGNGSDSRGAGANRVPLLSRGVPDLGLDALVVDDEGPRLELDPDCGLGVEGELVPREPRQDLRLPHRRVPDEHHLEHVVDPVPHGLAEEVEIEEEEGGGEGILLR